LGVERGFSGKRNQAAQTFVPGFYAKHPSLRTRRSFLSNTIYSVWEKTPDFSFAGVTGCGFVGDFTGNKPSLIYFGECKALVMLKNTLKIDTAPSGSAFLLRNGLFQAASC
jgi:hypothetical protein